MKRTQMLLLATSLAIAATISSTAITSRPIQAQQATPTLTVNSTVLASTPAVTAEATDIAPSQMINAGVAENGTITVDGMGQASAAPDSAVIELGVQNRAVTASVALSQTSAQVAALLDVLQTDGIAESDIQTPYVNLSPVYAQPQNQTDRQQLTGFDATNIVRIRVRDLDNLGTLLDAAVASGTNTIQSIQFELSDPATQLTEAREAATDNARSKAEQLASLIGVELGTVHTVVESSLPAPIPFAERNASMGGAVPISPGTLNVQVVVQITWSIARP